MTPLAFLRLHQDQPSKAMQEYLASRIAYHQDRASQASPLARIAARHGKAALAAGLLDEACAYRSIADSLADQQLSNTGEHP